MKTTYTLLLTAILSLSLHQGANAQLNSTPFTATTKSLATVSNKGIIHDFTLKQDATKTYLDWSVELNSELNLFEIERSTDGKNFSLAAIVFPTEKTDADNYMYYEKVKERKTFYRVKIILRNGTVKYSPVLNTVTDIN